MKKTLALAISLLSGALPCASALADAGDFICLKSSGLKKPFRLELRYTGPRAGSVRYQHGSAPIPLRLAKEEEEVLAPGRPSQFTSTWKETTPGGGSYTLVTQGARTYEARYVRGRDGKAFDLAEDLEAVGDAGCEWGGGRP